MFEELFGGLDNETIKSKVLEDLYRNGRINNYYFEKKSNSKENPLKKYIKKYLAFYSSVADLDEDIVDDCYHTLFLELYKTKADKIVEMLKRKPKGTELIAYSCRIIINTCFSKKNNSASSGLINNLLEKSSYQLQNLSISTTENQSDEQEDNVSNSVSSESLIIYDEDEEESFTQKYGISIEELTSRLTVPEYKFFLECIGKQKVGKPSKEIIKRREAFYLRVREIHQEIEIENLKAQISTSTLAKWGDDYKQVINKYLKESDNNDEKITKLKKIIKNISR